MVKLNELEYNLTIREAYDLFNQDKIIQGVAEIGTEKYKRELDDFLKRVNLCESDYVSVITQNVVNDYIIQLRQKYNSIATINHNIVSVRVFLYWCMNEGYIKQFKITKVKGQNAKIKVCTEDEVRALLATPNRDDYVEHRTHTIVSFFLGTGCRLLTLINLKKEDIDFQSKTITFRHLKNKKVATVPLSPKLERTLSYYIKHWDTGSEWLFCTSDGEQMKRETVQQSLARYCRDRKIRRISPHMLRHEFAREWVLNNGNVFMLKHMMTHASISTTEKYVQLFSKDIKNVDDYSPLNLIRDKHKTVRRAQWVIKWKQHFGVILQLLIALEQMLLRIRMIEHLKNGKTMLSMLRN